MSVNLQKMKKRDNSIFYASANKQSIHLSQLSFSDEAVLIGTAEIKVIMGSMSGQ